MPRFLLPACSLFSISSHFRLIVDVCQKPFSPLEWSIGLLRMLWFSPAWRVQISLIRIGIWIFHLKYSILNPGNTIAIYASEVLQKNAEIDMNMDGTWSGIWYHRRTRFIGLPCNSFLLPMKKHARNKCTTIHLEQSRPGCMWGIPHILNYHQWHHFKKRLPYRWHMPGRNSTGNNEQHWYP